MNYSSPQKPPHEQAGYTGILLVNLGTPDSATRPAVRRYLKEFLWDPRVVEMARPIWWAVLNLIVLNTRPSRAAHAYSKIWTDQGSPLLCLSKRQCEALDQKIKPLWHGHVKVALAMRYGSPSVASGLRQLEQAGVSRILVFPLYPQYSATTTASVFDAVTAELQRWRMIPEMRFINSYHDHPAYIDALAQSVRNHWQEHGRADCLLMSFHGIPEDYFHGGDPYFCHCQKTARLLSEALELSDSEYKVSFQSRLGPKQWLQPYTDHTLQQMAERGVESVQIICPGFSVDCLETLEEVAMENQQVFLDAGGKSYAYIPCLNDSPDHIEAMIKILEPHLSQWVSEPRDVPELRARIDAFEGRKQ